MNYAAHYNRLIERARHRTLVGYRERHHVVPKCMGGGNEPANIVSLTGEEHYVAHQLLVKMYPDVRGLVASVIYMSKQCTGRKSFAWLRRRKALSMMGNTRTLGKKLGPQTPEHIEMRIAPCRGKRRSLDTRSKISIALTGRPLSPEHREKIGASTRGKKRPPRSQRHIENLAAANRGKHRSPEHRAKISLSLIGNKNAAGNRSRLGVPHTPEAREKMSVASKSRSLDIRAKIGAAHRGKVLSTEHRAKISLALMGNTHKRGKKSSDETRAKISAGLLGNTNAARRDSTTGVM